MILDAQESTSEATVARSESPATGKYSGSFYAAHILRSKLPDREKLVLGFINAFGEGKFRASNAYVADCLNISEKSVANTLTNLRKKGLLIGRNIPNEGTSFPNEGTRLPQLGNRYNRIENNSINQSPTPSEDFCDWAEVNLVSVLVDEGFSDSIADSVLAKMESHLGWMQPHGRGPFRSKEHLLQFARGLAGKMKRDLEMTEDVPF